MKERVCFDEELEALTDKITERVKSEIVDSEYFLKRVNELHKDAFSRLGCFLSDTEGRLSMYVYPDDDSEEAIHLDLHGQIEEWIMMNEPHCENKYYLMDLINSIYEKRKISQGV